MVQAVESRNLRKYKIFSTVLVVLFPLMILASVSFDDFSFDDFSV